MSEFDRQLDAAWRAASREQPPEALDAALRAAARRAVGAGPGRGRATRWWLLAAAAALAVIAVGIVQLTPPERVAPTIVADSSPAARATPEQAAKPAAPSPPEVPEAARREAGTAAGALVTERAAREPRKELAQAPAAVPIGAPIPFEPKRAAAEPTDALTNLNRQAALAPERERAPKSNLETPPEPSKTQATLARAEPFPALAQQSGMAANAPAPAAAAPSAPPATSAMQRPSPAQPEAALAVRTDGAQAANQTGLAKLATADGERAKDAAPRPAAEWIKLIRRLRAEGKSAEAAKELAAFRAAYKERADALLPADLRETKP